jgi:hypothetical protein
MRFSARSPSPSPVRRYVSVDLVSHNRLGEPTFSAEGVSHTAYNLRPRILRRMTRKRTRLIPTSTALVAVAVRLYMLGRSERPAFHPHLLRRECRPFCFLFCLSVELDDGLVHSLPLGTCRSMTRWPQFAFERDTTIPMKNGRGGREEMPSYVPPPQIERASRCSHLTRFRKPQAVQLHRHKVN